MALDISGEYRISAPRERVWEALNDPAVLRVCIAGCKQLERVSDTEFAAIVVARVGPVAATFRGNVTLSELDPPNGYTLTGQGQGGAAGFARMSAKVALATEGDATVMRYAATADIGGKLASVGSRLVQSVAKKNADDFFTAFAAQFGGAPGPRSAEPVTPVAASAAATPAPSPAAGSAAPASVPAGITTMVPHPGTAPAWLVVFGTAVGCVLGGLAGYLVGHYW